MEELLQGSGDWSGEESSISTAVTNTTLSCLARSLQLQDNEDLSQSALFTAVRTLQVMFFVLITILGVVLNSFFLYLVCKYKKLQTPSFAIALQVSVLNILFSLLFFMLILLRVKLHGSEGYCSFLTLFLSTFTLLRVLLMFLLVVDRFLLVFSPFWYPKREVKVVKYVSVICWVLALVLYVPVLPGILDCIAYSYIFSTCTVNPVCGNHCLIYSTISTSILSSLTILPVLLYGALYYKAKKIRKKESTANGGTSKRQWKATVTFSLLFLTMIVLALPGYVTFFVFTCFLASDSTSPLTKISVSFTRLIFGLLVITDPIVLLRNKDVKETLTQLNEALRRKLQGHVPQGEMRSRGFS